MEEIMVSAATGATGSLVVKVTALLGDEYKLPKSMRREIASIQDELRSINAVLLERSVQREGIDLPSKQWMNGMKEMSYDFEDDFDKCMHHLQREPYINGFFLTGINKAKRRLGAHRVMAGLIQDLKQQILMLDQRMRRDRLDSLCYSGNHNVSPLLLVNYVRHPQDHLIAMDGPRDDLSKWLDDDGKELKVLSIHGAGGLGKTALAYQIYKNICNQFDFADFVPVSQKPDIKRILHGILSQINKQDYSSSQSEDMEQLISALRDSMRDKRFLIVIDDIWSAEAWSTIRVGLPDNSCGSRIIVTTRIASVAEFCCSHFSGRAYQLRKLSEADSIALFFKTTFGSREECPPHLKGVSFDIIRKCDGLPLAIITMARLLSKKSRTIENWIEVERAIGFRLEAHRYVDYMREILSLSYNDLPYHLRTCLLYLSVYPMDYEIQMCDLVWRWIAEGFIGARVGRSSQEVGTCYFNDLIDRGLIEPVNIQFDGQAIACRVPYMILDLIKSKAVEENFGTSISGYQHHFDQGVKIRWLSLDYLGQGSVTTSSILEDVQVSPVRSLGVYGDCKTMPPLFKFQALRVLDLESSTELDSSNLENVPKLFQLRYLRIKAPGLARLPEEIGKLHFLETLDVRHTDIEVQHETITELQQLRCLLVKGVRLPDGIGWMQLMEEMSNIYVDDSTSIKSLRELGSLSRLTSLGLEWRLSGGIASDKGKNLVSSIIKLLPKLKSLMLRSDLRESFDFLWQYSQYEGSLLLVKLDLSWGPLFKFPVWMAKLTNLKWLAIRVVRLKQETLDDLGNLPALMFLELYAVGGADPDEMLIVSNSSFQCLKVFHLNSVWPSVGLIRLMLEAGAMPNIENIFLRAKAAAGSGILGLVVLGQLQYLTKLSVEIYCHGARVEEVEALEAAVRNAASILPKCAQLCLSRLHEDEMIHDDPSGVEEANEEEDKKQHDQVGRKIIPKRRRRRIFFLKQGRRTAVYSKEMIV